MPRCGTCKCVDGVQLGGGTKIVSLDEKTTYLDTSVCPWQFTKGATVWLSLYAHYHNNRYLVSGGLDQQPARYLSAMQIIQPIYQYYFNKAIAKGAKAK